MSASRDARAADISELIPGLSPDELQAAVEHWCTWYGATNSLLDASAGDLATFTAKFNRGGNNEGAYV